MITLPGVGDIRAAGLTPEALAKSIGDKYLETKIFTKGEARGELKNYKMVTVNVVSFYQKIKKLVESLTTLTGGQQMQVTSQSGWNHRSTPIAREDNGSRAYSERSREHD